MDSKKIGITLMLLALVLFGMVYAFLGNASNLSNQNNCNPTKECQKAASVIGFSNIAFGIIFSILSLGFYILFFNNDSRVLERIEKESHDKAIADKFSIALSMLDPMEQKVLTSIKEQDGITQSTLRIRTDLSKAKLSMILTDMEKRDIIRRIPKGKSLAVFLKEKY